MISAYNADHIDFDIEGDDASNFNAATLRATALAELQHAAAQAGHVLRVSLTLPVNPTGLTPDALQILTDTVNAGVSVSMVNGLAMDYGDDVVPHPAGRMGKLAIDAATNLADQLHAIFPKVPSAGIESLIGIAPMIGINDDSDEIFSTFNAGQLATYAANSQLGMLSMWQVERDSQCPQPETTKQLTCSSVNQSPWEFSHKLNRAP